MTEITTSMQNRLITRLTEALGRKRARIIELEREYEALDAPLRGDGITNLELLQTLLREHRQMLDANNSGKPYPVVDPNASYSILGWMEEMLEQLRVARVNHAFPNGVPDEDTIS